MGISYLNRARKIAKSQACLETEVGSISYELIRSSRRKNLTICIDEGGDVSVSVPFLTAEREIISFINQKARWIKAKVSEAVANKQYLESKQFEHGHEFLFLGKKYPIEIQEKNIKRSTIIFRHQKWTITLPMNLSLAERKAMVRKRMITWYRQQAEEILGGRIYNFSRIMDITPQKIAVRELKRVWGNCDYNTQTIHLNWQIILCPVRVVDYVVIHEMCHLFVPNHSRRFWNKVAKFMPDYKRHQKWLKDNFLELVLPK